MDVGHHVFHDEGLPSSLVRLIVGMYVHEEGAHPAIRHDDNHVLAFGRLDDVSLVALVQEVSHAPMQQQQDGVPAVRGGIVALRQGDSHRRVEDLNPLGPEPEVDRPELWALPR